MKKENQGRKRKNMKNAGYALCTKDNIIIDETLFKMINYLSPDSDIFVDVARKKIVEIVQYE